MSFSENSNDSIRTAESVQDAQEKLRQMGLADVSKDSTTSGCSIGSDMSQKESVAESLAAESLAEKFASKLRLDQAEAQPTYFPVMQWPLPVVPEEPMNINGLGQSPSRPGSILRLLSQQPGAPDVPLMMPAAPSSPMKIAQAPKSPSPKSHAAKEVRRTVKKDQGGASRRGAQPATEKEWQARQGKRQHAIDKLVSNAIYYEFEDAPYAQRNRPEQPNPSDRKLSKRQWEEVVCNWRSAWRKIHGVCSLMALKYPEQNSTAAWDEAGKRIKRSKAQGGDSEEHAAFQERLQKQHLELALSLLRSSA